MIQKTLVGTTPLTLWVDNSAKNKFTLWRPADWNSELVLVGEFNTIEELMQIEFIQRVVKNWPDGQLAKYYGILVWYTPDRTMFVGHVDKPLDLPTYNRFFNTIG